MSNPQLAAWLTAQGYLAKRDELKNAKRSPLVEGVLPDTPQVRSLLDTLRRSFPRLRLINF